MANGNPAHNPYGRDHKGQYTRTIEHAQRDAHAAELRAQGHTYQQIADELGIEKSGAIRAVRRAIRDACAGPGKQLVDLEVQRLEAMYDQVLDILERDHPVVSHGRIVKDDAGMPLVDDEMKLKAIDRALRTRESFRKLLGLDAPSRVSVEAEQLGREITRLLDAAMDPEDTGDDDT
ncbi:hypothetical protein [Streptomyces sp. NK08204]|uniref:hypothetical protein n=1 Tax=Streptomyces sp. NK08204 TaxID=2873260 RepID=UPI001CEC188E|nr:hypothetical protein [Streptomyces sp. NK08204]